MATSYVGTTGTAVRGVGSAETGSEVDTFTESWEDPKDYLLGENGQRKGFAHGYDPSVTTTVSGEITAITGIPAVEFGTAATLANETDDFGVTAGGQYLDSVSIPQGREAWKTIDANFTRLPLIS